MGRRSELGDQAEKAEPVGTQVSADFFVERDAER
jgi:hypothetical protein